MTQPRRTPFRAGDVPGEFASPALAQSQFTGTYTLLADVSEFQPSIADPLYLQWSKAIVIRAMYGDQHDDTAWYGGQRRADLHAGGAEFVGIYQYIVASQDATAQAQAFCKLLGSLEKGEMPIADIEEGGGSQLARWQAWAHVVESELGFAPWDYSGLNFAASAGLAPVNWVAAYRTAEPTEPHQLWQFTSSFTIPGISGPCDCSVYHGTAAQLAAQAYQGASQAKAPSQEDSMGQFTTEAYPVFKAGQYTSLYLYRDFVSSADPARVRVAVYSVSKGYSIQEVTLTQAVPQAIALGTDCHAVSLVHQGGPSPVGYGLS